MKNILILIPLLIILAGCVADQENNIKEAIEKARYCSVKEDCILVESKCPFGCYIFVNKNEAKKINDLVQSYESSCIYSCIQLEDFDCIAGKCSEIITQ